MTSDFWKKQTPDTPLFEDLLWSRPENKAHAGKLLIIGGNLHGFAAPSQAYQAALKAGIGTTRIILPVALKKIAGTILEAGEYAPSTPSGSFGVKALDQFLIDTQWADGVLLAGDLGRNSETAMLLEKYTAKSGQVQLTITKDALDYFKDTPAALFDRPNTTLVMSFAQLQKLAATYGFTPAFTFEMGLVQLLEALHNLTEKIQAAIIVKHLQNILVAYKGQVSSTLLQEDTEIWRVETATKAATWYLQNPSKVFEALTTSIIH